MTRPLETPPAITIPRSHKLHIEPLPDWQPRDPQILRDCTYQNHQLERLRHPEAIRIFPHAAYDDVVWLPPYIVERSLDPETKASLKVLRARLQSADQVVVLVDALGLGDKIETETMALACHELLKQPAIALFDPKRPPIFDNLPGITYRSLNEINQSEITSPNSFYVDVAMFSYPFEDLSTEHQMLLTVLKEKVKRREGFARVSPLNTAFELSAYKEDPNFTDNFILGIPLAHLRLMQAMLVPQNRIDRRPDVFFPPEQLPPVQFEQLWFLDAKNVNDKYSPRFEADGSTTRFDSVKMVPEQAMAELFGLYPDGHGKTVAITLGVDHPEYCQHIFQLAQDNLSPKGWQVILLATDTKQPFDQQLQQMTYWIMQSRHVIGVDTGTMHLANVVARSLVHRNQRTIQLHQLFNGQFIPPQSFGLWGLPPDQAQLLVVETTFDSHYPNAANCLQYLTGHDLQQFLAQGMVFEI